MGALRMFRMFRYYRRAGFTVRNAIRFAAGWRT